MEGSNLRRTFDPLWLWNVPVDQREEIIRWLEVHGVNPHLCARFHVDGWEVECEMFEANIDGELVLNTRGDVKYTESKTFTATWWPEGVESELPKM